MKPPQEATQKAKTMVWLLCAERGGNDGKGTHMIGNLARMLFVSVSGWILLIGLAAWGGYRLMKPTHPPLTPAQQELKAKFGQEVSNWLQDVTPMRRATAFLNLAHDPFGEIGEPLRTLLWQSDRFDLLDYAVPERICRMTGWTRPAVGERVDAVAKARARGAALALWGRVEEFSGLGARARLVVSLEIAETATGMPIERRTFDLGHADELGTPPPKAAAPLSAIRQSSKAATFMRRLLLWALFTLVLPVAAYPLSKGIVTGESNAATLGLLIGYTLLSVLAAGIVFGDCPSLVRTVGLAAALGTGFFYMYHALTLIKTVHE